MKTIIFFATLTIVATILLASGYSSGWMSTFLPVFCLIMLTLNTIFLDEWPFPLHCAFSRYLGFNYSGDGALVFACWMIFLWSSHAPLITFFIIFFCSDGLSSAKSESSFIFFICCWLLLSSWAYCLFVLLLLRSTVRMNTISYWLILDR